MDSFNETMIEYRRYLEKGVIQKAYKGLMEYMMGLRAHFSRKYQDFSVPGSIYFGYMDMTYFSIVPKSLKDRDLKIAIVFLHEQYRFEAWLSAVNKQVQSKYWNMFKESGWKEYNVVPTLKGADSIVEHILVDCPSFDDLNSLTDQIESETVQFIADIESFLLACED